MATTSSPDADLDVLADTWWYGMTRRWSRDDFEALARKRASQGFDAVQLVAGIPPEVGPAHPQAASEVGAAWDLRGRANPAYLDLVRDRARLLLAVGLRPIVYGGWGPQVDWVGVSAMRAWWERLAAALDGLDVIPCLCGEVDLWCDAPRRLWPEGSTDAPVARPMGTPLRRRLARRLLPGQRYRALRARRVEAWREVLRHARLALGRPLLVHTTGAQTAFSLFGDDTDLLANTTQTGHDLATTALLYERPAAHHRRFAGRPFMNLEPWYEGIGEGFGPREQLLAFWASKLGGATGHVYGAQGVWNLGDGAFLAHWGEQTLAQATALASPGALGALHRWYREHAIDALPPFVRRSAQGAVLGVGRGDDARAVELVFAPEPGGDPTSPLDLTGALRLPPDAPRLRLSGGLTGAP